MTEIEELEMAEESPIHRLTPVTMAAMVRRILGSKRCACGAPPVVMTSFSTGPMTLGSIGAEVPKATYHDVACLDCLAVLKGEHDFIRAEEL